MNRNTVLNSIKHNQIRSAKSNVLHKDWLSSIHC
nr:MAG TPA: hypothetical protein [Bacteriophage sp.]